MVHATSPPDTDDDPPRQSREEAALYVDGLAKQFGDVTAVDDVSFTVETGEVVGLLGPNGAGKTTTVKTILGLVSPDEGDVWIDGIDARARPRAAHEQVDAMLEGARNDYWRLTVRENLRYFSAIRGRNPDTLTDRHEELLERFDLAEKADTQVRELSRGMKQKVSLASALAGDVSVAFLDEPTLGLDVESSLQLRREIVRLAEERGLTLIISSHDMAVIEDVCDRVVIMTDGRVVADEPVADLLAGFEVQGYRITARDVSAETVSAAREAVDTLDVTAFDDRTQIEVAADSAAFYRLMSVLESNGVELDEIETVQPDLAEAFVEMTGAER